MTPQRVKKMAMSAERKAKLEAAGFIVTTVDEFLGLTPEESKEVDRLALEAIRVKREEAAIKRTARRSRASRKLPAAT